MHIETKRKIVHSLMGVAFAALIYQLPAIYGLILLVAGALATFAFRGQLEKHRDLFLVSKIVKHTERAGKRAGSGVTWYFLGVTFVFVVFGLVAGVPKELVIASMLVVAIGDAVCVLVGRRIGKRKLPRTTTKSYNGSLFGFLSAFAAAAYVLQPLGFDTAVALAFAGAFTGMLAEAYLPLNDNLTIPVMSACAMTTTYALILLG
jgi:dolichol kinase